MPGRCKQPVDLIEAKGKKHLTKSEIEERKAAELQVPFTGIEPPEFLTQKKLREEFIEIATMLAAIGIWTELDQSVLGEFVAARALYSKETKKLLAETSKSEWDYKLIDQLTRTQNAHFKQTISCASKLGLTITDRCRIVNPKPPEEKPANKFGELLA